MRILVAGTGGVGGYFGGLLGRAGHAVSFLARGAHLQAIRQRGLVVHSVHGDFTLQPEGAASSPAELDPPDAILVAVKHFDLSPLARQLVPAVSDGTLVVPLLNGVDAHRLLADDLGRGRVVAGTCSIVARIESPGVIRQESQIRRIVVGRLDGGRDAGLDSLVAAWQASGVDASQSAAIADELWSKMIFIASLGGVTALARAAAGEVRSQPATRSLLLQAMREVEAVARASGARLAPDCVERAMATVDALERGATSSMQRDVVEGRRFELEALSGTIVRLAREHGIGAPVHTAMDALLRPILARAEALAAAA